MATVIFEQAPATTTPKFFDILSKVRLALRNAKEVSKVRYELEAMSDRELTELGITRFDIPRIAKSTKI